ncbi:MAG: glycosyltransferase [Nitrospiraceae bacterium]|nr:glycosyltransferase [Nitrospiraceae bacterium]
MRVVLFGNATRQNAATRYRLVTFARMLEADGHRCQVCLPSSIDRWRRLYDGRGRASKLLYLLIVLLTRFAQLRHVPGADVVFFRGAVFPYGPTVFEYVIRLLNHRMVFDIDDAVWERPAYVTSPFLRFHDFDWIWKMARWCRHGIVGNAYLQGQLADRGCETTIVPTCVDMSVHTAKTYPRRGPGEPVVLGWTGLSDNLGYMSILEDALRRLAQKHDIALMVASNADYQLDGVRVINRRWTLEEEIGYLQQPDIGLMPLTDSKRALGKCSFKALEFMAVGTPCVISPVGMNADIVEDGVTGFLAQSPEEWYEKLERLITDAELRETMGRAARQSVAETYAHEAHYPKLKRVFEDVASS